MTLHEEEGKRFTINGAQFGLDASAPPDAFEVAILDALTGQPVAGRAPLAGTDALLTRAMIAIILKEGWQKWKAEH